MSTPFRATLIALSLFFASSVLLVSLLTAQAISAGGPGKITRHLSLDEEIMPDHVLYPVVAGIDRLQLWTTTAPAEQVQLQAEYANRRLEYARDLLGREQPALAVSTLTKAEKYLQHASRTALDAQLPVAIREYLVRTMLFHRAEIKRLAPLFTDADNATLDKLLAENDVFVLSLLPSPTPSSSFPSTPSPTPLPLSSPAH